MAQQQTKFVCYNGDIVPSNALFFTDNRSILYGDGLFESMRSRGAYVPLLSFHLNRLRHSMASIGMNAESFPSNREIEQAISRLLHRNKWLKAARLRLTVFRKPGGLYYPENNDVDFFITAQPLETSIYELNQRGLIIGINDEMTVFPSKLTSIKSTSALRLVLASQWAKTRKFDDCLLINNHGHLVESCSSNLFVWHKERLYTPPLSDGCLPGIMRSVIIDLARQMKIDVIDNQSLTPDMLESAAEIFLTNAVQGIQWVLAYENAGYYHNFSSELINLLNKQLGLKD
ncbi:MAG TPA: aminotransferase class IV [Salinivirgaceae bacterium]|nr:aminotransferase class IV [Salinivirgaceae bacterium]